MLVQATRLDSRRDRNPPQWLRRAREVIHEQYSESLSLSSVAELVECILHIWRRCSASTMDARLGAMFEGCTWNMRHSSWPV